MSRFRAILLSLAVAFSLPAVETVQLREVSSRVRLMAKATAEESDAFNNPLHHPQIVMVAPDGAWLNAGDPVIVFDATAASNQWVLLLHQRRILDAEMQTRLTHAESRIRDLEDRLLATQDRLDVEMARLLRLRSLPDTNEARIAEGRWRVAELTLDAVSNELARAGRRLDADSISPASYERMRSSYLQARSRVVAAEARWHLARKPADPLDLERNALVIENYRLEVANLISQIEDTRAIVSLQKQGNQVRIEMLDRQIREQEDALRSVRVNAPRSGHVSFTREFLQRYMSGTDRMRRNFVFARMPREDTLVFRGAIDEFQRRFFAEGDPVEIRAVGRMSEPVAGQVVSVGLLARDRGEREESDQRTQAEYGIKAYDVVIRPETLAPWMRLGMHAECEIRVARPLLAASVPAEYLLNRDGQSYLVLDGHMRAVSGSTVDGWFVLQDTNFLGASVTLRPTGHGVHADARSDVEALFETSGELIPVDTVDVTVGSIDGWQKISWLMAEDTAVTSGTVVAVLEDKETRDRVLAAEQSLEEAVANRESARQSLEILLRQSGTTLETGSNNLRIAEIDWKRELRGADPATRADARLNAELTHLTANDRRRDFDAVARRPDDLTSPRERSRAERAWRKAALRAESAKLDTDRLETGPDPVAVERRRAALAEARLNFEATQATVRANEFSARVDLRRAERAEQGARERLDRSREWLDNLTIRAPRDGVVRYRRIWSGSGFARAAPGYMVSSGSSPLTIANMNRMEIRAEVPERYYLRVREGMPVKIQIPALSDMFIDGHVVQIEYLFEEKRDRDTDTGRYASQETLGETVFYARVEAVPPAGLAFKAGAMARVFFPDGVAAGKMSQ